MASVILPSGAQDWIVVAQADGEAAFGEPIGGEPIEEIGLEEPGEEVDFPPFDPTYFASQLLWLAITFIALYFIMSRVVLPRIGGILEDRRDRIARDLDHANRLKQQSDDAMAAYERALAEARAGAFAIAAEAREAAKGEAAARQGESSAKLDEKLAEAEQRIADIKERALADVETIAAEAAEAVVQRLIGKKPTAREVSAAVASAGQGASDV